MLSANTVNIAIPLKKRHSLLHPLSLQWRHNEHDGVSNHQPHDCLLNRLFRHRSKRTSKPSVTCLCAGNSSVTGEFPAQRASNLENISIWWHLHDANYGVYFGSQLHGWWTSFRRNGVRNDLCDRFASTSGASLRRKSTTQEQILQSSK